MKLYFSDGTSVVEDKKDELGTRKSTFSMGFDAGVFLRESCYRCRYCGTGRIADFTIADFWGVTKERAPEEEIRKGISLMLVNTDRARSLFNELEKDLVITPIDPEEAIPHNWPFTAPVTRPAGRDAFFEQLLEGKNYDRIIVPYYRRYEARRKIRERLRTALKAVLGEQYYTRVKVWIKRGGKRGIPS